MNTQKEEIRVYLYINGNNAKSYFSLLHAQKEAVEQELGYPLEWDELPNGQDSQLSVRLSKSNPQNLADWPRQHEWLTKKLNDMHRVLSGPVRSLDVGG